MWKTYFKLKKIEPGVVIYPSPFGKVDFSKEKIDLDLLRRIHEAKLPYIEMTDEGKKHFYPKEDKKSSEKTANKPK